MYLLFRHENIASLQPSSSNPAKAPTHTPISNTEQQLEKNPTDRTLLWEELPKSTAVKFPTDNIQWLELPKVTPELARNTSQEEIKELVSMTPLLLGTAMTTRSSSAIFDKDDEIKKGTDAWKANLLHVCPTESELLEITTTAKQIDNSLLISDSAWDKPSKNNECIIDDDALDLKGHADPVVMTSTYTGVQFIPLYAKSDIELQQFTLLGTFPIVTQIVGMPSKTSIKEVHWLMDEKSLWERRSKTTEILQSYVFNEDEKNKKETLRMVPSCPREARNLGFPSTQQYSLVFYGTNMVDICPGCPSLSIVSGLPSLSEDNNITWITQEEPLLEKQIITEPLMVVSSAVRDEMKLMGALLPSCPTHSYIQGIPSILQPPTAQHETDMKSLLTFCFKTSSSKDISSATETSSKKWAPVSKPTEFSLPEVETVITENKSYNNDMKDIAHRQDIALPGIRGLSSAKEPIVNYNQFSNVSLLPICPATSNVSGFPSIQKQYNIYWNTTYELLWDRQIKYESLILLEPNKMDKDMEGIIYLASSCPSETVIYGFPSISIPRVNTSMVCFSISCSKVSQIPGFPSFHYSEQLKISKETLFEPQMKENQVLSTDRCKRDEGELKTMVSLAPTCPEEARAPGFPCLLSPLNTHFTPNITSLLTMCSQASKIPGFPSVDFSVKWEWVTEKGSVMKRLSKKWGILDTKNYNSKIMKNIVSILPSCPKKSSILGFPCVSNPKIVYYGQNVVNLFPLCPLVSAIPGFSSVEMRNEKGWVEMDSLMLRAQKNSHTRLYRSPINSYKQKNMHALVPCCPHTSKIPGFPSVPRYNMLNLVPFCPKVSSMPGFASFEQASKLLWIFSPNTMCEKLKETVIVIHSPNQDGESVKKMSDLAPSCPEASRIPGFPSSPQIKSKIKPNMINFRPCCSSASNIKGFGSMCTTLKPEWPKKAILIKPHKKRAEMIMPFAGQNQLYYYKTKSMMTLILSCPKEARVRGFPSAQVVNRHPNMVSMYTSAPCVSHVPGFPSARMLSFESMEMQTGKTHCKILFESLQKKKTISIAKFHAKHSEEEQKHMVAMLPSCPHLAEIPGFPSVSQVNLTKAKPITLPSPSSIKYTSQEQPHIQPTQSHLKDERISDVSPSCSFRENTPLVYGETFTVLRFRPYLPIFLFFGV